MPQELQRNVRKAKAHTAGDLYSFQEMANQETLEPPKLVGPIKCCDSGLDATLGSAL